MDKKIIIYNAFRDINSNDKIILSCKLIKGTIKIGDEILINSKNIVKVLEVTTNPLYNEVNISINSDFFENFFLKDIINKEIKVR